MCFRHPVPAPAGSLSAIASRRWKRQLEWIAAATILSFASHPADTRTVTGPETCGWGESPLAGGTLILQLSALCRSRTPCTWLKKTITIRAAYLSFPFSCAVFSSAARSAAVQLEALITNCIPLHIQDNVSRYFDELLPYETFSVRRYE